MTDHRYRLPDFDESSDESHRLGHRTQKVRIGHPTGQHQTVIVLHARLLDAWTTSSPTTPISSAPTLWQPSSMRGHLHTVHIDRTSLSQAAEAQKAVVEGHVKGKLVIEIEPPIRERS